MANENYLTQHGLEKLKQEYNHLVNTKRKEVAERIATAKDFGDLSENAEYDAAKEEQAIMEARISELKQLLKDAVIIQENNNSDSVSIGSTIKVKNDGITQEYKIVGSQEADPSQGLISNESPIGRSFLGRKKGEIVEIQVPKGTMAWQILEIN